MRWRSALQCWRHSLSLMSDIATRQQNALWRWWHWRWLGSNVTMRWRSTIRCWWRGLLPTSDVATRRPNALQCWQNWRWPGSDAIANNNSNSDGDSKDDRNGDYGTNNPL
jgi:hypothetical protein